MSLGAVKKLKVHDKISLLVIKENLENYIKKSLKELDLKEMPFSLEHPSDPLHGDYATNVALVLGKSLKRNPRDLAEMIARELRDQNIKEVRDIKVAGVGFINFSLSEDFFRKNIGLIMEQEKDFGRNSLFSGKKIMVEYTDPNPFKEFHIGHLMPNAIGETLARLYEWSGGEVKRANYQGDVGLHVACALWGMKNSKNKLPDENANLSQKIKYLSEAYVLGRKAYDKTDFLGAIFGGPTKYEVQKEIQEINKKVYEKSDEEINKIYNLGRKWSLEYFEEIYKKLGTKFDFYFFESEVSSRGLEIVKEFIGKVFEESDGATVFRGERYGLHTRVFVNKDGLPTYEAKELGLALIKKEKYPFDLSFVVTGNEIKEYFEVLKKALSLIDKTLSEKSFHVPHGMLKLPTGKMSSRTGDVITAEFLLQEISKVVKERMNNDDIEDSDKEEIVDIISVGAIKFAILRQSIGKDITFDFKQSLSFEGDSGPYLQYTTVRANSVLRKAANDNLSVNPNAPSKISGLEKLVYQLPEIIERSSREKAPHYLVTYLLEVASAFNSYYGSNKIIDPSEESPYKLALTKATSIVLDNGLSVLGIRVPKAM